MSQHEHVSLTSFGSDTEKTLPLGVGVGSAAADEVALDPLANVSEARRFKAGSFILIAVIAVACGGIWFMKSLSKVSAETGGDAQVEATIDDFIKEYEGPNGKKALGNAEATVLAVLSGSYTERQVPLQNVQRNPFILYGEMPVALGGPAIDAGADQAQRRAAFEKAAERLELKSVIMSSQPLANISGKIVRKGDELVTQPDGLAFRISQITQEGVTITAQDPALSPSLNITLVIKRDK